MSRLAALAHGVMRAVVVLAALTWAGAALAVPAVSLRSTASATTVKLGATFQVDVVLTVNGQEAVEELELPDMSDFVVLRESESQQASFSVINGRRAVVVEHRRTFVLRASEAGTKQIGEATARLGGTTARAAPIAVRVIGPTTPTAGTPSTDTTNDAPDAGTPADTTAASADTDEPGARFGDALPRTFVELRADTRTAHVGEQITVVAEVYSQAPLGQYPRIPGQKPPGFTCLTIDDGIRLQASQRILKGRSFYVYPLSRDALFRDTPGKVTLPPLELEVSPAGSFFSRSQDLRIRSNTLDLEVLPLPEPPPEADAFVDGNVGRVELRAAARPGTVKVGEPFSVVVEVVGWGNPDAFAPPRIKDLGADARLFPPTTRRERRDQDGAVAGRVVEETLVQVAQPGRVTIPALTLVVFDPVDQRYVIRRTAPLTVTVTGTASTAAPTSDKRQTIAKGARPLMLDVSARASSFASGAPLVGGGVFGLGALLAIAASLRRRMTTSVSGQREARVRARAAAAQNARAATDLAAGAAVLMEALAEHCGDDVRAAASDALRETLVERGLPAAVARAAVDAIVQAEAARYAPGGKKQAAVDTLVEATILVDDVRQGGAT